MLQKYNKASIFEFFFTDSKDKSYKVKELAIQILKLV